MTGPRQANWEYYYKYGSFNDFDRVQAMLCDRAFYFPTPAELNDPADCRNIVAPHGRDEIEDFLVTANRQWYGDARNDDYIRAGIDKFGAEILLSEMTEKFNRIMDSRYAVFSLTRRPDNMAMWAKYADNHCGYCLRFAGAAFGNVYEVIYSDRKVPLSLSPDPDPRQVEFLYTKTKEWQSEEEARILTKTSGVTTLPRNALCTIILGEHCDDVTQQKVLECVVNCDADVSVEQAQFNRVKQKLEFLTIACSRRDKSRG